jgi:hypothetical protein
MLKSMLQMYEIATTAYTIACPAVLLCILLLCILLLCVLCLSALLHSVYAARSAARCFHWILSLLLFFNCCYCCCCAAPCSLPLSICSATTISSGVVSFKLVYSPIVSFTYYHKSCQRISKHNKIEQSR